MRAAGKTIKHSLGAPQQLGDYLFLVIDRDGQRNSRVLLVHTRSPRAQRTSRCALIAPFAATRAVGNKHADRRLFTAETPIPRPQIGCIVTSFHARLFRIQSEGPPPKSTSIRWRYPDKAIVGQKIPIAPGLTELCRPRGVV